MNECCALCGKENDDLLHFWDAKKYCLKCIVDFSPVLAQAVKDNVELTSELSCLTVPLGKKRELSWGVIVRNCVYSVFMSILFMLASQGGGRDMTETFFTGAVSFGITFFFLTVLISQYDIYRSGTFPLTYEQRSFFSHPLCRISEGKVLISFNEKSSQISFALSSPPFQYVFDLANVSLFEGDGDLDAYYAKIPNRSKENVLLLCFSKESLIDKRPQFFQYLHNKWLKQPFLVCCDDKKYFQVWRDFFSFLDFVDSGVSSRAKTIV